MNWYIIFPNDNKINDLLLYFNNHPEMTAFVPKIEKLMKKDGKKVFAEVPMFPNYIFIESEFNSQEFYQIIESLEKDMDSTMRIMQSDEQKVLSLANNEKELLESLFNDDHLITRSMGTITDSKLIVQKGPLVGKEEMIKKIDRHKRVAFIGDVFGKTMKVPLEVTSKT